MLRSLAFALLFICCSQSGNASHIVGGDFTATWLSANAGNTASTYRLKLTLYRDCETGTAPFDPQIVIGIFNRQTNQLVDSVVIDLIASGPLTLALNNQCSPPPEICVEGGIYIIDVEIPNNPNGYYISWERCCRNITVNNLINPDDTGITFYLEIPDPVMHNSTPVFLNDPLTYMCEGQPFAYNFGGVDPDGDSLVYDLITPVSGNIGYPVNPIPQAVWPSPISAPYANALWAGGYSLNNICGGTPLVINSGTGAMTATPNYFGRYAAAVECREYRAGVQIGMIRREIQFNVIICNSNTFPDVSFNAPIKNLQVYAGDTICFSYFVRDPEGDSLWLTHSGDIFAGGSAGPPYAVSIDKIGVANLQTDFCWLTSCSHARQEPYNVVFSSRDNGCPFPLTVHDTIKISVLSPNAPEPQVMLCMDLTHDNIAGIHFGSTGSPDPKFFNYYLVYRSVNGGVFTAYDTIFNVSANLYVDSNATAHDINDYCYFMVDRNACDEDGFSSDTICSSSSANDQPAYIELVTVIDDNSVELSWKKFNNWEFATVYIYRKINDPVASFSLVTILQNPASSSWIDNMVNTSANSYCYFIITKDACGNVSPKSNNACTILLSGNSVPFRHDLNWTNYREWTGGVLRYELWRKNDQELQFSKLDQFPFSFSYMDENLPLTEGRYEYRVRAVEGPGSEEAVSLSNLLVLEQPAIVFLPNAFSPNDDYHNDRWGAVTGYVKNYNLNVFNRWGQLIFSSSDPQRLWDGRFNGSPAPEGVYVYKLKFESFGSNKVRELEGSLTLIR